MRLSAGRVFPAFAAILIPASVRFEEVGKTLNVRPRVKFAFHLSSFQCVHERVTLCVGSTACYSRDVFIPDPELTDRINPHATSGTRKIFAF